MEGLQEYTGILSTFPEIIHVHKVRIAKNIVYCTLLFLHGTIFGFFGIVDNTTWTLLLKHIKNYNNYQQYKKQHENVTFCFIVLVIFLICLDA